MNEDILPSPLLLDTPQDVNPLLNHGFLKGVLGVFLILGGDVFFFSMNILGGGFQSLMQLRPHTKIQKPMPKICEAT